jgi:HPr kinase/phosphorylase
MPPIHASAFAYEGMGCLVMGESGSGKSQLVAEAILHGAQLIADDRVQLTAANGVLMASAPPQLAGVLELRGLGLIRMDAIAHPLHFAITLDAAANERLPVPDTLEFLGVSLPHLRLSPPPISALLLYLKAMREGRILPPDWHPVG